ncbi:hypothetical protein FGO68_gene14997 [Halteria grandinella]|uniref:EF-hand domain-containing protein n=1 Tax=Halteria grandinella TaxID=5974 RepID=A0A8J8SX92_HALGN|nr:hypothetical protein FGO68_gene14997 [Halteria grandinella]
MILRERLRVIVPLQKLYEKIFFDDYDLSVVCRPHDMYSDQTLKKSHFKKIIMRDVPAIQREANDEQTSHEFERLVEACPRTAPKAGDLESEVRIFYDKLYDEMRDLARLRLPINILYTRNIIEFNRLTQPQENAQQQEKDSVFAFKDPRLRHLNKGFKREELQVSFIDFAASEQVKHGIDEIIKFNCMTLEFNYMHDVFTCLGHLAIERTGSYDWGGLFFFYDKNHDNLLDKNELKGMIINCGPTFAEVTEAEIQFIFNVMSFFERHLKKSTFMEWIQSMLGREKKKLIYYTQYLDVQTMTIRKPEDLVLRNAKEAKFYRAIRGVDEEAIQVITPSVVKFLANEISLLGDIFLQQTIERSAMVDENDRVLIEFDSLIQVLTRFSYFSTREDRNELRVWLFNNHLFAATPKFYDKNTIYVDVANLMKLLKQETKSMFPQQKLSEEDMFDRDDMLSNTLEGIHAKIRDQLLQRQVEKAIEGIRMYSRNEMEEIGERELRKIFNQCLPGITLFQQNSLVESLRTILPSDDKNVFRRFLATEVISMLEEISHVPLQHGQTQSFHFGRSHSNLLSQGVSRLGTQMPQGKSGDISMDRFVGEIDEILLSSDRKPKPTITVEGDETPPLKTQSTEDFKFERTSTMRSNMQQQQAQIKAQLSIKEFNEYKENSSTVVNIPLSASTITGVSGKNMYISQPLKQVSSSSLNFTTTLNSFFDRLFTYLNNLANTDEVPYFELKLKRVMDILGEEVFRGHLDPNGQKGFVVAWEMLNYIKDPSFVFRDLKATEGEIQAFVKFAVQVAGLENEESLMQAKIKYAFLLAQIEQNFFIRYT